MNSEEINPFGHTVESELPHPIVHEPNWTEHYFFQGYDFDAELGICIHMGRLVADPTIWRPTIQVYLPNQELLIAKLHGRDGHPFGPGASPLKISCIEPFRLWSVEYDGVGARVHRSALMQSVVEDAPMEPVKFHLLFEAAGPIYGRKQDITEGRSVGRFHSEQICRMRGHFQRDGAISLIRGYGVRDHSSGPRDYGPVYGDCWFQTQYENGDAIMVQIVRFEQAEVKSSYLFNGATRKLEMLEIVEHPPVPDANTPQGKVGRDPLEDPHFKSYRIVLKRANGEQLTINGELKHAHAITYLSPMEELNGTSADRVDGLQMCECPTTLRRSDGVSGFGLYERTFRVGHLQPAKGRV
ncbi:MAG: hypothetical protein ABW034_21860 [Steroidobacteraceae bacterium]